MKTGLESLDTGASKITYSGNEGPKAPMQMAMADPMLVEQYQQYVFEMEEQGLQPMSFEEFVAQARAGMNKGGIAQLVKSSGNGKRPGYRGDDARKSAAAMGKGAMGTPTSQGRQDRGRQDREGEGYYDSPEGKKQLADQRARINEMREKGEGIFADEPSFIEKKIVSPTRKFIYGATTNNPIFEKKHINYLLKQGVNVPPNILSILEIPDDESIPFDLYQQYLDYKPTLPNQVSPGDPSGEYDPDRGMSLPMDAANYALVEGRKPGLIMSGDLGNFYKMENPKGAINPDTGKPFTNAEWDTFKRGVMEDRGITGPGEGQARELNQLYSGQVGGGGGGETTVPPVITDPETGNPFVPGSNLPFANYYVGMNPNAAQLAYGQQMGVDPRMYNLTTYADGGRIGYAGGGITGLRQGYFLGKLVKKIGRGIKKVVKSPVGKLALIGGLAGAGGFGPFKGLKPFLFGTAGGTSAMTKGLLAKLGLTKGGGAMGLTKRGIFSSIAGLSALPLIFGESQEEEEPNYYADASNIFDTIGSPSELRARALRGELPRDQFPFQSYYLADGGRVGLMNGGNPRFAALNKLYNINDEEEFSQGGSAGLPPITQGVEGQNLQSFSDDETPTPTQPDQMPRPMPRPMMAGRMNPMMMAGRMNPMMARGMMPRMMAQEGGLMDQENMLMAGGGLRGEKAQQIAEMMAEEQYGMEFYDLPLKKQMEVYQLALDLYDEGGMASGGRVAAQEGGLMDMGGMEKDYRNEGGFVPIGGQERADDVPARLSKNEFVFTADAVRAAGGGDIDKGAEVMENMMENLEKGGKVSEESQGLKGARDMFATAQRLEGVL